MNESGNQKNFTFPTCPGDFKLYIIKRFLNLDNGNTARAN